jgi:hypothetical protein
LGIVLKRGGGTGVSETFGFGGALARLKAGQSVRRRSWRPGVKIFLKEKDGKRAEGATHLILQRREGAAEFWFWRLDQDCVLAEDWEST